MKLTDLHPRWVTQPSTGALVGVSFACPVHAHLGGRSVEDEHWAPCLLARVHVPFANPIGAFDPAAPAVIGGPRWQRVGETFETLSLSPSVKCSVGPATHWHGFVGSSGVAPGEVSVLGDSVGVGDGIDWPTS